MRKFLLGAVIGAVSYHLANTETGKKTIAYLINRGVRLKDKLVTKIDEDMSAEESKEDSKED